MNKSIQKLFSEVPATYELVNHILTVGLDMLWRKKAARYAARVGGKRWLDICTGTGEMGVNLRNISHGQAEIYATDFSFPMLRKAVSKPESNGIHSFVSDINALPILSDGFDLLTISFATRNINLNRKKLVASFREFYRVLRPGGVFINLETSQPDNRLLRRLFHIYVKTFVKPIGGMVSGSDAGYQYLSHTIPRFYSADDLGKILKEAGFRSVKIDRMLFGVSAIHYCEK